MTQGTKNTNDVGIFLLTNIHHASTGLKSVTLTLQSSGEIDTDQLMAALRGDGLRVMAGEDTTYTRVSGW